MDLPALTHKIMQIIQEDIIFGPDGKLSKHLVPFEYRKEQIEMARFISDRLSSNEHGVIEAGTGTGKTIAYLVPAILYAIDNEKVLAVSTETKALQNQLISKDIPLARLVLNEIGYSFSFSVCYGSSNYACRRRFEALMSTGSFSSEDTTSIESIHPLFNSRSSFNRFDVRCATSFWNKIYREPDICIGRECAFFNTCAFQKARKEWASSNLLVMNHHLFFTNLAMAKTLLPQIDIVIFDEAHSLEQIGSSQLGFEVSRERFNTLFDQFQHHRSKKGILSSLGDTAFQKKVLSLLSDITETSSNFFSNIESSFPSKQYKLLSHPPTGTELLAGKLYDLVEQCRNAMNTLDTEPVRIEIETILGKVFMVYQGLFALCNKDVKNMVCWVERNSFDKTDDIVLTGQPVLISEIMRREVISEYESVFFVSATLTANGSFSFIEEALGIERHKSLLLPSPFDYKNNVVLYVGKEVGRPDSPRYLQDVAEISSEIISILGGRCMILFTSYRMLREVRDILESMIENTLLCQGDLPFQQLLDRYTNIENAVLLGTHSFWQGIDLPGDLLKGVIITKLPFAVPDYPPVFVKSQQCAESGKNPFYSIHVPEAIVRFKQGFGRLIRRSSDKGIIGILDSRVSRSSYGRLFINSIPQCSLADTTRDISRLWLSINS